MPWSRCRFSFHFSLFATLPPYFDVYWLYYGGARDMRLHFIIVCHADAPRRAMRHSAMCRAPPCRQRQDVALFTLLMLPVAHLLPTDLSCHHRHCCHSLFDEA